MSTLQKEWSPEPNPEEFLLRTLTEEQDARRAIEMFACLMVKHGDSFAYRASGDSIHITVPIGTQMT